MEELKRSNFAYKYPFSNAAKMLVLTANNEISERYLRSSIEHIKSAVKEGLRFRDARISYIKTEYVLTYVHTRMLLSAIGSTILIERYARAEAIRSAEAFGNADVEEQIAIASEIGIALEADGKNDKAYAIAFNKYISYSAQSKALKLINSNLKDGKVNMNMKQTLTLFEEASRKQILHGLPIKKDALPKEIILYAKSIDLASLGLIQAPVSKIRRKSDDWIEHLLITPIPDVRHRTVNLILAPYFVNIRGMDVANATKAILEYIDKCKELEPNTNVNESYIRYQCTYAKNKKTKPMSRENAKELLGSYIDI